MATRTPRMTPQARREQLLDCTLEVLTENGFGAVNVEAVARRAGVTRPVVYDTFGDLGSLMLALIDRADAAANGALASILGAGDPEPGVQPEAFLVDRVCRFLEAVRADPRTWRLVLMPPPGNSPELRARIQRSRLTIAERVRALLDWGVAARGGPPGLDHELLARLIVAVGEDAARLTLAHPRRFSPERLAAASRSLVGLIPPADVAAGLVSSAAGRGGVSLPEVPPVVARAAAPAVEAGEPGGAGGAGAGRPRRRVPQSERREQLLDVTLELLAEEGFEALSMEAIARRAGVNRVVIYRSFANLPVLLAALMHREDGRVRGVLRGLIPQDFAGAVAGAVGPGGGGRVPAASVLVAALGTLLRAVAGQPATWRVALLRPESAPRALQRIVNRRRSALARRIEPLVRTVLADARAAGSDPASLDGAVVEAIARMLLTLGEEQGRLALDEPEKFPPARLLGGSRDLLAAMGLA
jgi:AcrR family transcriptional regulator